MVDTVNNPQNAGVQISASADGSSAVIDIIFPKGYSGNDISRVDVDAELSRHGITDCILWQNIDDAIQTAVLTQKPQVNITIAQMPEIKPEIKFLGKKDTYNIDNIHIAFEELRKTYELYVSKDPQITVFTENIFAEDGNNLVSIEAKSDVKNIFGELARKVRIGKIIPHDKSIKFIEFEGQVDYVADSSGYLAVDNENKLCLLPPVMVSQNKMEMTFLFLPASFGQRALYEVFFSTIRSYSEDELIQENIPDPNRTSEIIATREYLRLLIKKGIAPEPGRDAELIAHVKETSKPSSDAKQVDYKELTPYQEVFAGQVIVEKIKMLKGKTGYDIYGKEIPCLEVYDVKFNNGKNVIAEDAGDKILYKAAIDGVLYFTEDKAYVEEDLSVQEDIGPQTGNISYSRDIEVAGNVCGKYKVECGGNITVKGSIENGAIVKCGGDLTVLKGIIGMETSIEVKGMVNVGYIQDSNLKTQRDLEVRDYIFGSNVFCGGELTVLGKSLKSQNKGCVAGGIITCMGNVNIHSAGSPLTKTELFCGVNTEITEKAEELKEALPAYVRKISRIQGRLDVDLTDAEAVKAKLLKMSDTARRQFKQTLCELKKVTSERENILEKIKKLNELALAKDLDKLRIKISNQIIPTTIIHIGHNFLVVDTEKNRISFSIRDGSLAENSAY